jgi:hypothetical protein
MIIIVKLVVVFALLVIWASVWYSRRPRASSASPTTGIRIKTVLKTLFCVTVFLGALVGEVVGRYNSSPRPYPELRRTVAFEWTDGETVYITPEADRLFSACFAISIVTFVSWMCWPSKKKANEAKNRQSERRCTPSVCPEVAGVSASQTQRGTGRILDQSERLEMPATTFSYYWQRRKWNRYVMVVLVLAMSVYIWFDKRRTPNWLPMVVMSCVDLWVLTLLIDYRTTIDKERGTFIQEKLLFGRYRVGAVLLPLSEFIGVALDRYDDSDNSRTTFYVCLRRRNGRLMQVCYFAMKKGQRSDDAERAAQELAEMTGLEYEEISSYDDG